MTKNFRSFKEAREFARSLGLKSRTEWGNYSKSGNKPDDIPGNPTKTYKNKGWKGWGDFLGTGNIKTGDRKYHPFEEAREFARTLGLKSPEWREYSKSGQRPEDIPGNPRDFYKNKGWTNWSNFLGTGFVGTHNRKFRPFKEAREFARTLGLKSFTEWNKYCKTGKPDDIPQKPNRTYKGKGWISLGDWLGTGTIASRDREYRPFEEAREFARSLGLKSGTEWEEYSKSGQRPEDIPATPSGTYKNKGWKGIGDWLGKQGWYSFKEAREFVRSLGLKSWDEWDEYSSSEKRPSYIPSSPWVVYSKERQRRRK